LEQNLALATGFRSADSESIDEGAVFAVVNQVGAKVVTVDAEVGVADPFKDAIFNEMLFSQESEVAFFSAAKHNLVFDQID
jgi:hypothetical protein